MLVKDTQDASHYYFERYYDNIICVIFAPLVISDCCQFLKRQRMKSFDIYSNFYLVNDPYIR